MDLLILFLALALFYSFFRSQGGKGLSIKFQPPRASTPEGREFWIKAYIVMGIVALAIVVQWFSLSENSRVGLVLLPFLAGASMYVFSRPRGKK